MSRENKLVKNTVILSIGTFFPKIVALITLPIYTANLSKAEYGTYDLVTIIAYIMTIVVTIQIHQAAFRFLIGEKDNKTKEEIISSTILLITPLAIIASSATSLFLSSVDSIAVRIAICIYIFMEIMLSVIGQITRGLGENRAFTKSAIVQSLLNMAFVVVLMLLLNTGFIGMFISLDIAILCAVLYLSNSIRLWKYVNLQSVKRSMLIKMISYSWPMVPNTISIWLVNVMNRFIIIATLGIQMSAVYAIATKIPNLFTTSFGAFNMAWQESASTTSEDKDSGRYYSKVFDSLFGFLVGIMAILIAITPMLFVLFIRGDYEEAYYQMPILFMGMFFSSLSSYYGSIYIAVKETKSVAISSMIGAAFSFLINIMLIRHIGLYAASIAVLISYLVLTLYRGYDSRRFRIINYKKSRIFWGITLLVIMCIFCYKQNVIYNVMNVALAIIIAITYNIRLIKIILVRVLGKINR